MSKILIEYERLSPTLNLFIDILNRIIDRYGGEMTQKRIDEIQKSDFAFNDIVVSIRGNSKGAYSVAKIAKENGKFYCLLMDDNLIDPPPFYRYKNRIKYANRIAKIADAIIVTNNLVGEICKNRFNSRIVKLDSIYEINSKRLNNVNNNGLTKIVFAANANHNIAFEKYITPILKNIERKAYTDIQFDFIGVFPKTETNAMTINYYMPMPMDKYRDFMKNGQYNIGIAIVENNFFSNCKYINKFLEYTISDTVGIFTDCPLYNSVIKNKVNGFLTENTPRCWEETLLYAINNPETVSRCLENAKDYIIKHHNSSKIIDRLKNDLPELINYEVKIREKRINIWKIRFSFFFFVFIEKLDQGYYYMMNKGIKELYLKVKHRANAQKSYYDEKRV